jgi:hypothetical protein
MYTAPKSRHDKNSAANRHLIGYRGANHSAKYLPTKIFSQTSVGAALP